MPESSSTPLSVDLPASGAATGPDQVIKLPAFAEAQHVVVSSDGGSVYVWAWSPSVSLSKIGQAYGPNAVSVCLALLAVWLMWRWRRHWFAPAVGERVCGRCWYDLRGCASPTCPECGAARGDWERTGLRGTRWRLLLTCVVLAAAAFCWRWTPSPETQSVGNWNSTGLYLWAERHGQTWHRRYLGASGPVLWQMALPGGDVERSLPLPDRMPRETSEEARQLLLTGNDRYVVVTFDPGNRDRFKTPSWARKMLAWPVDAGGPAHIFTSTLDERFRLSVMDAPDRFGMLAARDDGSWSIEEVSLPDLNRRVLLTRADVASATGQAPTDWPTPIGWIFGQDRIYVGFRRAEADSEAKRSSVLVFESASRRLLEAHPLPAGRYLAHAAYSGGELWLAVMGDDDRIEVRRLSDEKPAVTVQLPPGEGANTRVQFGHEAACLWVELFNSDRLSPGMLARTNDPIYRLDLRTGTWSAARAKEHGMVGWWSSAADERRRVWLNPVRHAPGPFLAVYDWPAEEGGRPDESH